MGFALPDDRTLRRIAAILLSLAALAECAGTRSFPVRWFLLTVLRHAEAVARAFVVETARIDWPRFEDPAGFEGSPLEAAWLAACLRAFAAILLALLPAAGLYDESRLDCPPRRAGSTPAGFSRRSAAKCESPAVRRCAQGPPHRAGIVDRTGHVAKPLRGASAQAPRAPVPACAFVHIPRARLQPVQA